MDNNTNEMVIKRESLMALIRSEIRTKQYHDLVQVWMDRAMEVIEASRKERLIFRKQLLRMEKRWIEYEKRIRALEKRA